MFLVVAIGKNQWRTLYEYGKDDDGKNCSLIVIGKHLTLHWLPSNNDSFSIFEKKQS